MSLIVKRALLSGILLGVPLLSTPLYLGRIKSRAELHAETGQAAIRLLADYASAVQHLDAAGAAALYHESYGSEHGGFWREELASDRDGVRVYRWGLEEERVFTKVDAADQVSRYFGRVEEVEQAKFKLASLEEILAPDSARVRSVLLLRGRNTAGDGFESEATFRMWLAADGAGEWTIRRQELIDGKTVIGDGRGFSDITTEAGIDFVSRLNPLESTPEWELNGMESAKYATAGVSTADFDGDGWYDLFFGDGARPRLYRNAADGTFADVTTQAGLPPDLVGGNVGLFADFDNDGDPDLFVGFTSDANRLFRNDGDGTFTDVTEGAGLGAYFVTVASASDYDNDGLLDLYLGRYLDPRTELPTTVFYSRNGEGNSLLRNLGGLRFADVTEETGTREGGLTLGTAWADYDEDGDQDLYVANDFGRNALFRNDGDGTFSDVAWTTGTLDYGFGMSATFADIDNDLDLDIYVANVHSGQRWYSQAATIYQYLVTSVQQRTLFADFPLYMEILRGVGLEWTSFGDRIVKGNSLLLNDGDGRFTDVSVAAHANPFGWYWSSPILDYDNDGWQDIYTVNGWITGEFKDDL